MCVCVCVCVCACIYVSISVVSGGREVLWKKNEAGKNEVANLKRVVQGGLSAKLMFSRILQMRE